MSREDHEALVRRYVSEVLVGGNLEMLDEICAPGYLRHLSPNVAPLTLEAQKERLRSIRAAFPDWTVTIEDLLCEGDRVAFRATVQGTHVGPLLGIDPTGRKITVSALDILSIEEDRFAEHWGGPDMLGILRQLGATIGPSG